MVYFLSTQEIEKIKNEVNKIEVDESLRGWNYNEPPLKPPYDFTIPVSIIANKYCETGRDVYLAFIEKKTFQPPLKMIEGILIHKAISNIYEEAKKFIYNYGKISGAELYSFLINLMDDKVNEIISKYQLKEIEKERIKRNINKIWIYEALIISANLSKAISMKEFHTIDSLIQEAYPFTMEYLVNGEKLGLSGNLYIDAFGSLIVFDIKTGPFKEFHKLSITGYALAIESNFKYPINAGCIVYLFFKEDIPTPIIKRKIHIINESERFEFIEERDKKMRIIAERIDPGKPFKCDIYCPFYKYCVSE